MKVKVKMNNSVLKKLNANQVKAANMVAEQMVSEIVREQRIPFDEGTLQNVQTNIDDSEAKTTGVVKIIHDTPYAARLYYHPEYNFDKTINKNAGGLWWDDYLIGSKKDRPAKLFRKFYSYLLKGVK